MSGIQYFFDEPIDFIAGHIILPDTEWRLSAIAQPQFWRSRRGWWDGYRSVISVDIGDWNRRSRGRRGRTAWESTANQIAKEVWRQLTTALGVLKMGMRPPTPLFYHIDDEIEFDPVTRTPYRNRAPLLINRVGTYQDRPGRFEATGAYHLHAGRLVFCGTFMQTATRLTTMEAANESARRAVNAILTSENYGVPCRLFDPEEFEPPDLAGLRELDRQLLDKAMPHMLDTANGGHRAGLESELETSRRPIRRGRDLADPAGARELRAGRRDLGRPAPGQRTQPGAPARDRR
jgi:hypothetical protein